MKVAKLAPLLFVPFAAVVASAQYSVLDWGELPERAQSYARLLGYEEDSWDEDDHIPAHDLVTLPPLQAAAVKYLGMEDYFRHFGWVSSWTHATHAKLKKQCNSETNASADRPIPDENDWKMLRDMYIETVGKDKSSLHSAKKTGFLVPYRVGRASDGGGRAVFAAEDVPAGTHVWNGTGHLGFFEDKTQYVQFLTSFSKGNAIQELGSDWTCDMVMWGYADQDHWTVGLGDGSMIANADDDDLPNLAWPKSGCSPESGPKSDLQIRYCKDNLFAVRDIRKGEELRSTYNDWPVYLAETMD